MGLSLSKFMQPLEYSCYELGHTWNESCSGSTVEVGMSCFYESLKIYSSVYAFSTLLRGKKISREMLKSLIGNILQSATFLSYNSFGFVWVFCTIRKILGFSNYLTVGFLPGLISSFLAILVERPSRRPLLAVYVGNVATESGLTSLTKAGILPTVKHGEIITFSIVSSTLMYLFRTLKTVEKKVEKKSVVITEISAEKKESSSNQDFMFTIIRMLVGKSESHVKSGSAEDPQRTRSSDGNRREKSGNIFGFVAKILFSYWKKTFESLAQLLTNQTSQICPHRKEDTCLLYIVKGFLTPFAFGTSAQILLNLFKRVRGKSKNPIFGKGTFSLGLFLGSFGGLYKFSSCLIRRIAGRDSATIGLPAGFAAGLSMFFYPSKAMSVYAAWKTMEILIGLGVASKRLPRIPLFVEIVYATATAALFHLSITEPQSLKPSYFAFMNRITGDRVNEINRYLIDHACGTTASQMPHFFPPNFKLENCGEKIQKVWPQILEEVKKR